MRTRRFIACCSLLLLACGCRIEPPLYLRQAIDFEIALTPDLDVDLLWQADWKDRWAFAWDAASNGSLGYEAPRSTRMHSYVRDLDGQTASAQVFNFMGTSGSARIMTGMYDFLFYNNDSEALLFDAESRPDDIYAYTRVVSPGLQLSMPVQTLAQKVAGSKSDGGMKAENDPVVLQPDGLFTLFTPEQLISDDVADYEFIDGRYVIRITGTMHPADFIWLFQVRLLNNRGRVVGSGGGCALTGMADGVDLKTGVTGTDNVTVPSDLLLNRTADPDLMAARFVSFGIPGCNAYAPASVRDAPEGEHFLVLNILYNNGSYNNLRVDVTGQLRALPTGGVITLELDVDDFPPESGGQGGGFAAVMQDWDERVGEVVITR